MMACLSAMPSPYPTQASKRRPRAMKSAISSNTASTNRSRSTRSLGADSHLQTRMEGERVRLQRRRASRSCSAGCFEEYSGDFGRWRHEVSTATPTPAKALMQRLKPAEQRLISFALDLGTLVNVRVKEDRAPTFLVRAINGVFQAHYTRPQKIYVLITRRTNRVSLSSSIRSIRTDAVNDTQKPEQRAPATIVFAFRSRPKKVELP